MVALRKFCLLLLLLFLFPFILPFYFLDAAGVVESKSHVLDNHQIDVSRLEEECPSSTEDEDKFGNKEKSGKGPDPEINIKCVVSGFSSCTTEDTVRYYFQNARRSGGGDILEMHFYPEQSAAEITFKDPKGLYDC